MTEGMQYTSFPSKPQKTVCTHFSVDSVDKG